MIIIGNTLVSEDLFDKEFICNLSACKGACCIEGDSGAPVTLEEKLKIEQLIKTKFCKGQILSKIKKIEK